MSGAVQARPRVDLTPRAVRFLARYPGQIPAVVVERALQRMATADLKRARRAARDGAGA